MQIDIIVNNRDWFMKINTNDLILAQKKGIISSDVLVSLLEFLKELHKDDIKTPAAQEISEDSAVPTPVEPKKKFTLENFLYYFGAWIIISAMGWYMGLCWEIFGHGGLLFTAIAYFAIFTGIGNILWKRGKKTPGGLLYVCAVSIVPVAVWAFETLVGIMPKNLDKYNDFHILIRAGWMMMEIMTIIVGAMFLKFRKFPFLTLPICYAAWYLSMDIVPLILGSGADPTWGMRNFSSIVFAITMLGFALKYDKKTEEDFSFWLYLFGAIMLWGALWSVIFQFKLNNEITYFLHTLVSLGYVLTSIIIQRKVFMVFGAVGVWGYVGHIVFKIFSNSPLCPFVMVLFGLCIIFSGIYYSKNCEKIENTLRNAIMGK